MEENKLPGTQLLTEIDASGMNNSENNKMGHIFPPKGEARLYFRRKDFSKQTFLFVQSLEVIVLL